MDDAGVAAGLMEADFRLLFEDDRLEVSERVGRGEPDDPSPHDRDHARILNSRSQIVKQYELRTNAEPKKQGTAVRSTLSAIRRRPLTDSVTRPYDGDALGGR